MSLFDDSSCILLDIDPEGRCSERLTTLQGFPICEKHLNLLWDVAWK